MRGIGFIFYARNVYSVYNALSIIFYKASLDLKYLLWCVLLPLSLSFSVSNFITYICITHIIHDTTRQSSESSTLGHCASHKCMCNAQVPIYLLYT